MDRVKIVYMGFIPLAFAFLYEIYELVTGKINGIPVFICMGLAIVCMIVSAI